MFLLPHGTETVTNAHVIKLPHFTAADLGTLLQGWLVSYLNYRESPWIPFFEKQWFQALETAGREL